MKPLEYQEEWLSAYLDDELTEQQRQIVAARLASDPRALATLEDLKRVRKLVSELAPWSGQDLRVDIVSLATTSQVSADNYDSFEDVPQSLGTADELRSASNNLETWTSKPGRRFQIAWVATAVSILLLLGLGSAAWLQWGKLDLAHSDAMAATSATAAISMDNAGTPGTNPAARASALQFELKAESELEKRNELVEVPVDGIKQQSHSDFAFRTVDTPPLPAELALPGPAAMAVADLLDPQATGSTPQAAASEPLAENASATANFGKLYALGAGVELQLNMPGELEKIRVARSSAWSEAEVQAAFAETLPALGLPGITPQDERVANQRRYAGTVTGSPVAAWGTSQQPLLLAALKPTLANARLLFEELVDGNQLTAISLSPSPLAKSTVNLIENVARDKGVEAAREQDAKEQQDKAQQDKAQQGIDKSSQKINDNLQFSRQQPGAHSIPDSIALFLTETEAKQVLEHLKQRGLVASQIWYVASEQEARWFSLPSPTENTAQAASRGALGEVPLTKDESLSPRSITAEKQSSSPRKLPEMDLAQAKQKADSPELQPLGRRVILLLSSPLQ